MKKALTTISLAGFLTTALAKEESLAKTKFSLEVDPATILMKGGGIHAGINPFANQKWFAGISLYTLEMPDFAVDMNSKNKDEGWDVKIKYGLGLYAEYFFNSINKNWLVGGQIGIQRYSVELKDLGSTEYTLGLILPYFGYSWSPFKNNFYLKPWAGAGLAPKLSGNTEVAGEKFSQDLIIPFAALHLGYTF